MKKGYLGIDIGSISTKAVLLDEDDNIISSCYLWTKGSPINAVKNVLKEILKDSKDIKIVGVGTTGSARRLIGSILNANVIKNEITAHAIGTSHYYKDVRTIIEIGGQDSKIILLENGLVTDYAMNTLCAAGTGAFLSSQAKRLGIKVEDMGKIALLSKSPAKLAARCTVFAESDLVHKAQIGYTKEDLVAGLCNSVASNYIHNVAKGKKIYNPIIFQGGVSKNIGVKKAFEDILQTEITTSDKGHLMGAIGIALLSKLEPERKYSFDLNNFSYTTSSVNCEGCPNNCEIILIKNKDKIKGIFITHGHEDHIGALPYILKKINIPIYGAKLSIGLIQVKLKEHKINNAKLNVVSPRDIIKLSHMEVEFIKNNHSIPDACSIAVHTDQGIIYHTGDFKIDLTPIDGEVMDIHRICELSKKGVLLLLAESTNAEQPGSTMSEKTVGAGLDDLFRKASNSRIIVATFASNIHRLQQIINTAEKFNRKVAVSGRSMVNVVAVATELGYLNIPDNMLIDLNDISKYEDNEVVLITTGSQGEPMSALARMASAEHKKVEIKRGDLIIISAHPIPGNEKLISKVINSLFEKGAEVVYDESDIHVSGHAKQEELKLMHRLVRPKFFMPAHGEYRMLKIHAELAEELGMPSQNIFVNKTGDVLEIDRNSAKVTGTIPTGNVLVDGLGVGDVGNIVLRDRKHLSEDGLMIVVVTISKEDGRVLAGPDIISRGFVYVRESEDLMDGAKNVIKDVLRDCEDRNIKEWAYLKNNIKENLKEYLYQKTKRNPMILPIIMEV